MTVVVRSIEWAATQKPETCVFLVSSWSNLCSVCFYKKIRKKTSMCKKNFLDCLNCFLMTEVAV